MLVWFRPLTRHRPALYAPKHRSAIHGMSQRTNCVGEQRRTPRAINSRSKFASELATWFLLSRARCVRGLADPGLLRVVVNLGIGIERFEQAEGIGPVRVSRDLTRAVIQIAEGDRAVGAGLDAGG